MRKIYYFFITALCFLSYSVALAQPGCSDLEITAVQNGSVCGEGSVTLSATSSGTGNGIYWYNAATGGAYLGSGSVFETPAIASTSSFWAAEVIATGITLNGEGKLVPTAASPGGYTLTAGLEFVATSAFTIVDVEAFSYSTSGGSISAIELQTSTGQMIQQITNVPVPPGGATGTTMVPFTIPLSFNVPGPGTYRLMVNGNNASLARDSGATNAAFPHAIGSFGQITDGILTASSGSSYYYFYNWTVSSGTVTCESPREEVVATVNNIADIDIATLPYSHTANTATYFNNYEGAPGADCGTTDAYLYGNDVVYKYTADDDYILDVTLENVSEDYTAVFVYKSCTDIGVTCAVEGSVNESMGNHGFQMAVEDGEDYYFVISSAKPTDSFDYTFKVNGTTCANYSAPTGAANQSFVTGQTLSNLDVTGLDLTWYSDAATTTVLTDDTVLVDATTYYVTQTFQSCEGNALAITVTETACTALEILSTEDNSVCGEGSVTLSAQATGSITNSEIYWYDVATGGDAIGKGSVFETPVLEKTTSFWASEIAISGQNVYGQALASPTGTLSSTTNGGVIFNVTDETVIVDVEVFSTSAAGGVLVVELRDINNGNAVVASFTETMPTGGTATAPIAVTLPLNFTVAPGDYRLIKASGPSFRYQSGSFPLPLGNSGAVTSGATATGTSTLHYMFYNWTVFESAVLCESDRVEVIATVNEVADEIVNLPLPYAHTANTSDYDNNYFGSPGRDCSNEDYLDGHDVVYQFSPTLGGVYSIQLSGLSSTNAGVFVYESCYDIGTSCYAGVVSDGTTNDFGIDEVILNDGQDYFILISTKDSSSTNYTLTIDIAQIDCVDYTTAPVGGEMQYVDLGSTLEDLKVKGGNMIWYSDATLAPSSVIPNTTPIVDATIYYVTQTLNGCESDYLEIIVYELDCSKFEIANIQDATIVCKGVATISAEGSTIPGVIYWYADATTEDILHVGAAFTTPELTQTTSYWVAEVFAEGVSPSNPLPTYCVPYTGSNGCNSNDRIEDFILVDANNKPLIEHLGSGCSPGAYDDLTGDSSLAATLVAGSEYGFTVTHATSVQYVRIWIDLDGNGSFEDDGELVYKSTTAGSTTVPTIGAFEIPQDALSLNTVMRVRNSYSTGDADSCALAGTYGEVHDYKLTIIGATIMCQSPREEVVVTVTEDGHEIVGNLPYSHSENTGTYGNAYSGAPGVNCGINENYLNGSNVVYMYTATEDDLITIELTDLDEYYAGVFVYEVCANIGDECMAGAVAGPTTNDVMIQDFPVETGKTYYIVVSSWLTDAIDYTIKINSFSCADLEMPLGDSIHAFVAGDTMDDLQVEATRVGAVLTWYSDAALTTVIPDLSLVNLVDNTTYYVTQTLNDCESIALVILAEEIDCSALAITDFTEGTVTCRGVITLKVEASSSGNEIYWYDVATGGARVGKGNSFTTPELTQTTSYWATEAFVEGEEITGQGKLIYAPIASPSGYGQSAGVEFTATESFVISSVVAYSSATTGTVIPSVELQSDSGQVIESISNVPIPNGASGINAVPFTIDLNFTVPGPGTYRLMATGGSFSSLIRDSGVTNADFPHAIGNVAEITQGILTNSSSTSYYYFYNWTIGGEEMICESPRQEIVATVDQSGDIQVDYTDLPYADINNTSLFGNNFSGNAGTGCDGTNYLNGNEALYYYEADPNKDEILRIEISDVNNPSTAMFIYNSCGEVGIDCVVGAKVQNRKALIEDFYVSAGESFIIVVSSTTGTTDYTLSIEGMDCTNVMAPTGDVAPYFAAGNVVADLVVDGSVFNEGFKWYRNAALTDEITDINTEVLTDGTSYFVTQTLIGCESIAFEIIPMEFDCGLMGVTPKVEELYTCAPGGELTLDVSPSGIGSSVFWYDAETDGNILGMGNSLTVNVNQNSSYWVTEVFTTQGSAGNTALPTYCPPVAPTSGCGGDHINDFILKDSQGTSLFSHLGTGCSTDAYGDYTQDSNLTATLVAGGTYNFEATFGTSSQYLRIWIDYDGNGSFEDAEEFVFHSTSPGSTSVPTLGSFTVPQTVLSANTVMRVRTTWSTGAANPCSQTGGYGEVHDYKVTLIGAAVVCEASRKEIKVIVNDEIPASPIVSPLQKFCGNGLLSEIIVLGENIRWYDATGRELDKNAVIVEGETYYVTQTIKACESAMAEVVMRFSELSEQPVAAINQSFLAGDMVSDLEVFGENLAWYTDRWKSKPLSADTKLVDQMTYYVAQNEEGKCESNPLAITVHETLNIIDVLFEHFVFHPNPVEETLFITNNSAIEKIELFELSGRKVLSNHYSSSSIALEVSELATGTYILKATVDGMDKIFRIIKK